MNTLDAEKLKKYVELEYPAAVKFYDDRSITAKRWYRVFSVYLIVVSATLTVVAAFAPNTVYWKVFTATLSATIGVAASVLAHFKFHENWLSFRATWDALERERRVFEAGVEHYSQVKDRGALFVSRIKAIRAREGDDFYARHRKVDEQSSSTPDETKPIGR